MQQAAGYEIIEYIKNLQEIIKCSKKLQKSKELQKDEIKSRYVIAKAKLASLAMIDKPLEDKQYNTQYEWK